MLSMTGYGKAAGKVRGRQVQVELRSLNSKSLELALRLPQQYKDREAELRRMLSEAIRRGKADLTVTCESSDTAVSRFNGQAITGYVRELKKIARALQLEREDYLALALGLPDAVRETQPAVSDREWKAVLALFRRAVRGLDDFRRQEGRVIEKDLAARVKVILKLLGRLSAREPARMKTVKARLLRMLGQPEGGFDKNRFEQELIFYLERMDITEEKVRLRSHCNYFLETMHAGKQNGKKLGFIAQEIGREINTIGAKANDAAIQRWVVMMKDELEKIKEQLANVL